MKTCCYAEPVDGCVGYNGGVDGMIEFDSNFSYFGKSLMVKRIFRQTLTNTRKQRDNDLAILLILIGFMAPHKEWKEKHLPVGLPLNPLKQWSALAYSKQKRSSCYSGTIQTI